MRSKYELQASFKSSSTAYLLWFLLGAQYAYLNKWGLQVLYWLTFGGLGIWMFIDIFRISGMVKNYNNKIALELELLEKK
jgi:hypothetical protein